jgi:hypothetical protein
MAADGRSTVHEESNIRDLVENCVNNDDITPLVRLVFEAQSIATDPKDISGAGLPAAPTNSSSSRSPPLTGSCSRDQAKSVSHHNKSLPQCQPVSLLLFSRSHLAVASSLDLVHSNHMPLEQGLSAPSLSLTNPLPSPPLPPHLPILQRMAARWCPSSVPAWPRWQQRSRRPSTTSPTPTQAPSPPP